MVTADGTVAEEEVGVLTGVKSIDQTTLSLGLKAFKKLRRDPLKSVLSVSTTLDQPQKYTTFLILLDIASSNGTIADEERALLDQYLQAFGIDDEVSQHAESLISSKNQSVFSVESEPHHQRDGLTPRVALGLACISMIAADDMITEEELGILRSVHVLSAEYVMSALTYFERLGQEPERCVEEIARTLDVQQQMSTLAIMFDIALADGELGSEERRLLDQYIERFSLSIDYAQELEQVITLKNAQLFEV